MSHQTRRDPLPAEYQFPTHGVDCDCQPCLTRAVLHDLAWVEEHFAVQIPDRLNRQYDHDFSGGGYGHGV